MFRCLPIAYRYGLTLQMLKLKKLARMLRRTKPAKALLVLAVVLSGWGTTYLQPLGSRGLVSSFGLTREARGAVRGTLPRAFFILL